MNSNPNRLLTAAALVSIFVNGGLYALFERESIQRQKEHQLAREWEWKFEHKGQPEFDHYGHRKVAVTQLGDSRTETRCECGATWISGAVQPESWEAPLLRPMQPKVKP